MRCAVLALCAVILWPAAAFAATYLVRPDGTGDFPTIQTAIHAAVDGDVVELADGTFQGDGNRDISYLGKALTVRSQSGNPEACILDCVGPRGFRFESGESPDAILMGVTVTGAIANGFGWEGCGGAVRCYQSSPTIRHCVFYNNMCRGSGAAIYCQGGSLDVSDCRFDENRTAIGGPEAHNGGGIACNGSALVLSDCTFYFNMATDGGGISLMDGSVATVTGCTFTFGVASGGTGIHCDGSSLTLTGSTLLRSGIYLVQGTVASVENTVIAFTFQDAGIRCEGAVTALDLSCCDLFGNDGGDWVGCVAGQSGTDGNIGANPLFCDWENGDVTLRSDSPCAADNNPGCGQIGSQPVACGATVAEKTTWGGLKARFR